MRALLALPEGTPLERGWSVVLAIHDIFGFSPDVRRIARRFAESGYDTLAPPAAGHSYMNDHGGILFPLMRHTPMHNAYNEAASEDSWRRMLDFFGEHL